MLTMLEDILTENVTTCLVFSVVFLSIWACTRRPKNIPPGPRFFLPLLGNLLQVGACPETSFGQMRKQYGDVFSVYLGNHLCIVINGFANMKEAFVKNKDIFSSRPHLTTSPARIGVLSGITSIWKEQRKFALTTLKNLGMGKNIMENKILVEVSELLEELHKIIGQATDVTELLQNAVFNVINTIVLGKRFQYHDPKFTKLMKLLEEETSISPLANFLPLVEYLPGDVFNINQFFSNRKILDQEFLKPAIREHLNNYDEDNIDDFISAYVQEMKHRKSQDAATLSINKENLLETMHDIYVAGTETSVTSIRWFLLLILHFPQIQEKCFAELNKVVGRSRPVCLKDKANMSFLEATIMETLRFCNIAPLAIPHSVSKDITFKGYRIPKDSVIIPNLTSVLSDPAIWGDPETFRPERFLDENGKVTKPDEFIPFFFGSRACLGESLAKMELFLFIANIIQNFRFVADNEENLPSLAGEFRTVHVPGKFRIRVIPRD